MNWILLICCMRALPFLFRLLDCVQIMSGIIDIVLSF